MFVHQYCMDIQGWPIVTQPSQKASAGIALGADAVLLGRAYAYGLGAAGRDGVRQAIELLRTETELTLALMGMRSIEELRANRGAVRHARRDAGWSAASGAAGIERLTG
ncbi:alpha-hydroxy-acid oxidizing protein [Burkholderia gladioli]|uniref:alpha-hydroxy-acid oxidizing protein n=1 Tax=Burkholderia gladioli TaxID=28095 RepID=UPI00163EBC84|nr:alpha-hydroxy-acid oxidizing protein [Burkholderia gladioli]